MGTIKANYLIIKTYKESNVTSSISQIEKASQTYVQKPAILILSSLHKQADG